MRSRSEAGYPTFTNTKKNMEQQKKFWVVVRDPRAIGIDANPDVDGKLYETQAEAVRAAETCPMAMWAYEVTLLTPKEPKEEEK